MSLYQDGVRKFYSWAWNGDSAFLRDLPPGTYNVAITYYDDDFNTKAYWWNGGTYADRSEIVVRAGDSISIVAKAITRVAPAGARLVR